MTRENLIPRKENLSLELERILVSKSLTSWYQPIIDVPARTIIGYEALVRGPENSALHLPGVLFTVAQSTNQLKELEFQCLESAINNFLALGLKGKLFLNIASADLDQIDNTTSPINQLLISHADKIDLVLEISEKYPLVDYDRCRSVSDYCQQKGIKLAIDDLGSGYSGLRTWAEIRPEFVKLDKHFITNIHTDSIKREFVNSISEISRGLNCRVIAEGIEHISELNTLRKMGLKLCQGYLFQKPLPRPMQSLSSLQEMLDKPSNICVRQLRTRPIETVAEIVNRNVQVIAPDTPSEVINDLFKESPDLNSLPVVKDDVPMGMVTRHRITGAFSARYSYQLFGRKPISELMERPILADIDTRLDQLSQTITNTENLDLNRDFIVTKDTRYVGVGSINNLLRVITEHQVRYARYSNPLTLLPGNVPAMECIDDLLLRNEAFYLAYVDLNNFKPFNDEYGYTRGDEVLLSLSDILVANVHPDLDKVFHIGGDDFIVIFRSQDWEDRVNNIFNAFETARERFYDQQALANKGIWGQDRKGNRQFFALLTIAIGVVCPDPARCYSHHQVS